MGGHVGKGSGSGRVGVRVDVKEELNFFVKIQKKWGCRFGGGGQGRCNREVKFL